MILPLLAIVSGVALLVWSAGRFVEGAAVTARHAGMPPLLIGMVIVGFGTSAPEMLVSALASAQGNSGIALGNAYGSNITNIALILGLTALLSPIVVYSRVLTQELPILLAVTVLTAFLLSDGHLGRNDAWVLLGAFGVLTSWSIWEGIRQRSDALGSEIASELEAHAMPLRLAVLWLVLGLILLIASSRMLVWGAVEIALGLGISDLLIGLTIVAVGTSLPELASSLIASRKGEHDIALGNVLGSNLFNTLAVVGIAGWIHPSTIPPEVLSRDVLLMGLLTLGLVAMGFRFRGQGRINRFEGAALLLCFFGYTGFLVASAFN